MSGRPYGGTQNKHGERHCVGGVGIGKSDGKKKKRGARKLAVNGRRCRALVSVKYHSPRQTESQHLAIKLVVVIETG